MPSATSIPTSVLSMKHFKGTRPGSIPIADKVFRGTCNNLPLTKRPPHGIAKKRNISSHAYLSLLNIFLLLVSSYRVVIMSSIASSATK